MKGAGMKPEHTSTAATNVQARLDHVKGHTLMQINSTRYQLRIARS
jgi:hypothetical protein